MKPTEPRPWATASPPGGAVTVVARDREMVVRRPDGAGGRSCQERLVKFLRLRSGKKRRNFLGLREIRGIGRVVLLIRLERGQTLVPDHCYECRLRREHP